MQSKEPTTECLRVRGRTLLVVDCILDNGQVQIKCCDCPLSTNEFCDLVLENKPRCSDCWRI